MRNFQGKVAAITGAGSGIGRALVIELASCGCHLALADVDGARLAETQQLAQSAGARVTSAVIDVSDRDAVFAWAAQCRAEHGQVNLIFNNAGVALAAFAESTQPADFEWLMSINFWGVVHGTQAFLPHLHASGEGHVVNISSIFGVIAMPTQSAYCASKFAVRGYTEALRMELELSGAPVSATCVHPGGVATNIALASRVDPEISRMSGLDAQAHRERSHRMIQVTSPESAALQIIAGVQRNARRVLVGPDARRLDVWARLLGSAYQLLILGRVRRARMADRRALKNSARTLPHE
jgi:NAD(P)-dependent dehydrogenase (short-subunit alcohol dehydrogenase family)